MTVLDQLYPIGSIAFGTKPKIGTWTKLEGRFLLGSSSTYKVNSTGGEATHKLTANEMPSHTHGASNDVMVLRGSAGFSNIGGQMGWSSSPVKSAGGNAAHNNMPPYLVVDMWKRTA